MKKIFIITGEPSGDKLASEVISKLNNDKFNIEYSCVGGTHLNALGIRSIFDQKRNNLYRFYKCFTKYLQNKK